MTRDLFLQELRIALQGQIPQAQVNEHLRYYENYIMEESRKGRTEEEVIAALGNPRLIAKTIIETSDSSNFTETDRDTADNGNHQDDRAERKKGFHMNFDNRTGWDIGYGKFKINSWYGYLIFAIILIVILVLVAKIAIVLIPVLVPAILVATIIYLIFFSNRK